MKNKPEREKKSARRNIKRAELLIDIWNKHDQRDFEGLENSVSQLLYFSGVRNSEESAKLIAHAYHIHGDWDDNPHKSIKIRPFKRLDSIWLKIENELKEAAKIMGVTYHNKAAHHHTCWWMYYSALNLFQEDRITIKLKRYLCFFLTLWHIFLDHRIKTASYIGAVKCTYLLFKGAKYAHAYKRYNKLGERYLARYWYISQKYYHPTYMF